MALSKKIKGITIEISGNTTKLEEALKKVEESSQSLNSELKGINSMLKMDPSNIELLKQKYDVLNQSLETTEKRYNTLKDASKQVEEQAKKGIITQEQYRDFHRELILTEKKLSDLTSEMVNFGSVTGQRMKYAGQKVKEFSSGLNEAASKMKGLSIAATAAISTSVITASSLEDATKQYLATVGKSAQETEKYQKVLQNIHDKNYGEDYADIADKMRLVSNILGDLPDDQLQNVVEKAYMLESAYGMDFQETIRGVNGLVKNMGLNFEESFDYMVKGAQNGLEVSGELGDNLAEYTQIWSQAGFSAKEMFEILENGLQNGAYNLDKVNDFVKEFTISLADGRIEENLSSFSNETSNLFYEWKNGEASSKEVFYSIINDLEKMENQQTALTIASNVWSALGEDNSMTVLTSLNDVSNSYEDVKDAAEEANKMMYDTSSKKAEAALRKLKSSMANLGSNLLPVVNKIIDKVNVWIDKFNNLDDKTQKIILSVAGLAAAAAPVLKISSSVVKNAGNLINVSGRMISAFKNLTLGTKTATTAQLANNAAVLANPYVLAAAAVAALTAAIIIWYNKSSEKTKQMQEETKKIQEETDALKEQSNALKETREARDNTIKEGVSELNYYDTLYQELQGIVDKNGEIKKGYEARAKFIISTLSEALGIEIDLVGNQITNYNELNNTFDKTLKKKKSLLILESQEEGYKNAIKNINNELQQSYEASLKMKEKVNEREELLQKMSTERNLKKKNDMEKQLKSLEQQIAQYLEQYNIHQLTYNDYLDTISMYEENYANVHNEKYDDLFYNEQEYVNKQKMLQQEEIGNLQQKIAKTKKHLDELKELKDKNNSDVYNSQIEATEKELEVLQNSLIQQQNAVKNGNMQITKEWLDGQAVQLSSLSSNSYAFEKIGNGTVQMYINGVKTGQPVAENQMVNFMANIVNQINNKKSMAEEAGENIIAGVSIGLSNRQQQNKALNSAAVFGSSLLATLKNSLKEHSPSKATEEMGSFLLQGLSKGIDKERGNTLKQVSDFGNQILNNFQNQLNGEIGMQSNLINNSDLMLNSIPNANRASNNSYANSFQELLSLSQQYFPQILDNMKNLKVYLDQKTLVGKIAPEVDQALGSYNLNKGRGY